MSKHHEALLRIIMQFISDLGGYEAESSVWTNDQGSVVIIRSKITGQSYFLKIKRYEPKPIEKLFDSILAQVEKQHDEEIKPSVKESPWEAFAQEIKPKKNKFDIKNRIKKFE